METRVLGRTGMAVSALGFGGAEIGYQGASEETVKELLSAALAAGLNVIDTAECYDESEELIGRAIGRRRNHIFLFTKCGHASGLDLTDWDPKLLERSIDRSLKRLRTDYLDLVQLHSCSEAVLKQGDAIAALQRVRSTGKTRFIGYSGDGKAARYAVQYGAFDTLQTSVSIADQEAITLTLPLAQKANMGVIAKRPIANVAWLRGQPEDYYGHTYWERLQDLDYPFLRGDAQEAIATALRFTLTVPGVHTAIVGTAKPGRWQENAALVDRGPVPEELYNQIRERWIEIAQPDWVGQG